jgi:hypothetical protein
MIIFLASIWIYPPDNRKMGMGKDMGSPAAPLLWWQVRVRGCRKTTIREISQI